MTNQCIASPSVEADKALRGIPSILYIGGYGRSGSTILDIALSASPGIEGLGEASEIFDVIKSGEELPPLWHGVRDGSFDDSESLRVVHGLIDNAEHLLSAPFLTPHLRGESEYATLMQWLFRRIHQGAPEAKVLVDGSKTSWGHIWRPLIMSRIMPDVKMVILVRGLDGVTDSIKKGRGNTLSPLRAPRLRALVGWLLANLGAAFVGMLMPSGSAKVLYYSDFVSNPATTLGRLSRWAGAGEAAGEFVSGSMHGFETASQIAGNRVRKSGKIRIIAPVRSRRSVTAFFAERLVDWVLSPFPRI